MTTVRAIFSTEPALVMGFLTAALGVLVAFHLPITDAQQQAILACAAAAWSLGTALIVRDRVTPNATAAQQLATVAAPQPDPTPAALDTPAPEPVPTVPAPDAPPADPTPAAVP